MVNNSADPFAFGDGFQSLGERLLGERQERMDQRPHMLSFGVHFLDCSLKGILPTDLIILGAKTGHGKTALATLIAA